MSLRTTKKMPGCRILWTNGEVSYIAKGMSFFVVDDKYQRCSPVYSVGGLLDKGTAAFRLSRHLLRSGIHHLQPLKDGSFLVVIRKRVLRVEADGNVREVFRFIRCNKPYHQGVCVTPDGFVFLAEYPQNFDRKQPVAVYRSKDDARAFEPIMEFRSGLIRHIHFVQWDDYGRCLWLGTGDRDDESWIYKSADYGDTWERVGGGSQLWRAVSVSFRPEALYWGTDAGSDAGKHSNYVMRLDRENLEIEKVLEVEGPCHGNASLADGTLLVSTGVEGGINERDRNAHLWMSRDGKTWQELMKFEKDRYPMIVHLGVIRFPQGLESCSHIAFTCLGLSKAGETAFVSEFTG